MSHIVIFHTADLHNRLAPAAARQLAALKRAHPRSLLLDAGDAVAAGNLGFRPGGEPILRLMAETGYDAMAMGNRESHPNRRALMAKLRDAAFPVLAANLTARRGRAPEVVRGHVLFAGPPRVAVIGLAPQITRPDSLWARVTDFVFEDPVAVAAQLAPELKREVDLVVCLSHCGLRRDRALAAIPQVDLVLGGHSHREVIEQQPDRAMVVHPGRFGSHVSHTEIDSRAEVRTRLIPLEAGP
jgi:5'-nucleotidase